MSAEQDKELSVATGGSRLSEALPCIVCGRRLDNVTDDGANQPYNGLAFTTHGHYGSTIYDLDLGFLTVSICDDCVVKASEGGMVRKGVTARARPLTVYSPFKPQEPRSSGDTKERSED